MRSDDHLSQYYMHRLRAVLTLVLLALLSELIPGYALAHNANQQPFVALNGADAALYQVGSTSLTDFDLPQDKAPEDYLVGQPVAFTLKTLDLPFPAELIPKLEIHWDFGDGASSDAHDATHTYTKMGTYVVRLTSANPSEGVPSQLLDLILLNVLPSKDYKLPQSVITVDGRQSKDPYTDILHSDFKSPLKFSANSSQAGSSEISSYFWDFGDQNRGEGSTPSHLYTTQWSYVSVMLRIKTKDGFISDSMVQIENPDPVAPTATPVPTSQGGSKGVWIGLGMVIVLSVGAVAVTKLRKRQTKEKEIV